MKTIESRKDLRNALDEMFDACGLRVGVKGEKYLVELPNGFIGCVMINYAGKGEGSGISLRYGLHHPEIARFGEVHGGKGWPAKDAAYSISHLALDPDSNGGLPFWSIELGSASAEDVLKEVEANFLMLGKPWMERAASWPEFLELTDDPKHPLAVWTHPAAMIAAGAKEEALAWARETRRYAADSDYRAFVDALA